MEKDPAMHAYDAPDCWRCGHRRRAGAGQGHRKQRAKQHMGPAAPAKAAPAAAAARR